MWNSIHKFGLSDKEIQTIADDLLAKELPSPQCPDCGAEIGKTHMEGCDVSRCTTCGGQELSCECDQTERDKWDGYWPGTREALKQKLICCWGETKEWTADLNELARRRIFKL